MSFYLSLLPSQSLHGQEIGDLSTLKAKGAEEEGGFANAIFSGVNKSLQCQE